MEPKCKTFDRPQVLFLGLALGVASLFPLHAVGQQDVNVTINVSGPEADTEGPTEQVPLNYTIPYPMGFDKPATQITIFWDRCQSAACTGAEVLPPEDENQAGGVYSRSYFLTNSRSVGGNITTFTGTAPTLVSKDQGRIYFLDNVGTGTFCVAAVEWRDQASQSVPGNGGNHRCNHPALGCSCSP